MLHQVSWFTYGVTIFFLLVVYYLYVGVAYFRPEIRLAFNRLTAGQQPTLESTRQNDPQITDDDILGKAQHDAIEFVSQDEILFGPSDTPDEPGPEQAVQTNSTEAPDSRLIISFSEMISEVKTLIRVINESSESKENFEMLFRLIVQKYPELVGTIFQDQVNNFLLSDGTPQFPFDLSLSDLDSYWTN